MDINEPLHGQIHLWMIAGIIILGFIAVSGNKGWAKRHAEDRKATSVILGFILIVYALIYSYLTFFYREPMEETHLRLEPFWSYREAFDGLNIRRLSVARSILLNIAITIPLGYLLPALFHYTKHRYFWTLMTVLMLSIVTETVQLICKTGLAETDDVINNVLGCIIGFIGYFIVEKIMRKG